MDRSTLHWTERDLQNFQMLGAPRFPGLASWTPSWTGVAGRNKPGRAGPPVLQLRAGPDYTGNEDQQQRAARAVGADATIARSARNPISTPASTDTIKFRWPSWTRRPCSGWAPSRPASERDFFQKSFGFEEGIRNPSIPGPPTAIRTPIFTSGEPRLYTTEVNTRGATNYVFPRRFQIQQFGDFTYDGSQEILAGYFKVEQAVTPWLKVSAACGQRTPA